MQQVVEAELKKLKEDANFKATPVKLPQNVEVPERVRSNKQPTKAVGITLASDERSVKR